jgi:hypothetical protein
VDEYREAIAAYQAIVDDDIQIRIIYVAKNDRVMAARVEMLNDSVRFFDVVPHISIAKMKDAQFRESNDLVKEVDELRCAGIDRANTAKQVSWKDIEHDNVCLGRISFKAHGS